MLNVLSNTDLLSKVITLLVALLTLITAVITLKKSRAEKVQLAQGSPLKLRSLRTSESTIWRGLKIGAPAVMALISIVLFISVLVICVELWFSYELFSAWDIVNLTILGASVGLYSYFLWAQFTGTSLTVSREATLNVQGDYDQVMENCIAALKRLKVRVTAVHAKEGMIEGVTRLSFGSFFGERIFIRVTEAAPDEYAVHMKSRTSFEGTLIDWGRNARNVDRFFNELIH